MNSILKPGMTFWVLAAGVAMLLLLSSVIRMGDMKTAPGIIPGVDKAVVLPWHFHIREVDTTRVVTPLQTSLAKKFGPRVYKYAKDIREVNAGNKFPSNNLLLAIAATESSFRSDAESSSSAGLLQINYKAHNLEKHTLFDVKTNVKHSVAILQKLDHVCAGNMKCTLLSYNVGHKAYMNGQYDINYYNKVVNYLNL